MLYLYTALYQEAKPVIKYFGLKREQVKTGFDIYANENMRLILTGTGSLAAATAVGSSLAFYHAGSDDFLVNWGSCASEEKIGTVYRCYCLTDRQSGYVFYPDMCFFSSLPEAALITEAKVWKREEKTGLESVNEDQKVVLHDMEAGAVYFAGSYFLSPHQMHFLKVVSDHGDCDMHPDKLAGIMEEKFPVLLEFLEVLTAYERQKEDQHKKFGNEFNDIESICEEFHCSVTMKNLVSQCIKYWSLAGIDYHTKLENWRETGVLPCIDRKEGKKRWKELEKQLL